MARGSKKPTKKSMVWEGRFKNVFKNIHFLHGGAASASLGSEKFYKQANLVTKKRHVTGSYNVIKEVSKESLQLFGSGSRPYRHTELSSSGTPRPK